MSLPAEGWLLEAPAPMVNTSTIVALLRQQIPGFSPEQAGSRFGDLGIDSFGLLELLATIERATGAPMSDTAWGEIETPEQLMAYLQRDSTLR